MENTPRNIVLQLGALITLYLSASFLLTLVFGLVNLAYPDAADSYWNIESAGDSVRLGIAMLVVFFPTYVVLTRLVNTYRRAEHSALYQNFTKWLMYLSLLIGGLILLGTLVTVLYTFLNGDLTTRFILKAAAVLAVVGAAFHYYILDAKGYWMKDEGKSIMFGIGAGIVVFLAIAFGLQHIDTPTAVREMKLDEQQVYDLQMMQSQIANYMSISSSTLPTTLDEAYGMSGTSVPTAAPEREAYTYETTPTGFKLCATFSRDSVAQDFVSAPYMMIDSETKISNPDNWNYKAGRYCFERIVR